MAESRFWQILERNNDNKKQIFEQWYIISCWCNTTTYHVILVLELFKKNWRTWVYFVEPLIPLFLTSGDIGLGFQSESVFPCLYASLAEHKRFLRFTSGATPASACQPSHMDPHTAYKHWWGLKPGIMCAAASQHVTWTFLKFFLCHYMNQYHSNDTICNLLIQLLILFSRNRCNEKAFQRYHPLANCTRCF